MKKFAFVLPQFHSIPENDEWWGEGFTEWTNVRKAVPLYKGHVQPVHPQNDNYYCLLDKETVLWQNGLMHAYGIDGFIYYHYYFRGKLLLEKPAENLLEWKDIKQPFFFCWANHDWNRSWQGRKEVLLKQEYGVEEDWERHFQYLLPFFKDDRYEKVDNMPVFMLFLSHFKEKKELIAYWDKRCRDEGFNGLYVIETFHGGKKKEYKRFYDEISDITKKYFYREPTVTMEKYWLSKRNILKRVCRMLMRRLFPRNAILWRIRAKDFYYLQTEGDCGENIIHGISFGFDNTSRHGKRGIVVEPPTKEDFDAIMQKYKNEQFIFINAWNEWAEKMILEPTEEWGDRYLGWIKEWSGNNSK